MLSISEIIQNGSLFDHLDFRAKYRINNQLICFDIHSIKQIFMGEIVSIKKAIDQKLPLQWLLDLGESHREDFHQMACLSICWNPKENECYIGNIWIEPDFRGNGLATVIFNEIIYYADELGIILTLRAIPFLGPDKKPSEDDVSDLARYYKRFGFKRILEPNEILYDAKMERLPQKKGGKGSNAE
jgi:GNAT superfamily N-acetyltransferase